MATNLRPIPPPLTAPLLDKDGLVTKPWGDFFTTCYRYMEVIDAAVADGTYTLGDQTTDGTITITTGIITAIQEAVA